MKSRCCLALAVALTWTLVTESPACGPSFPVSYFPSEVGSTYRVTPHLGAELGMIGAHYYPAWTGKAPQSNRISSAKADELDFAAAGAAAGRPKENVAEDWRRYVAFGASVCKRLENGEKVEIPQGIPDYALEFYLYRLGHSQWLVFRKDEDPSPFGKLLALPKGRRLYRTVWVHFVRIANARTFVEKDRHVDALRQAVDDGFRDTAGLESFTLRFLTNTCGVRYAPLVITAYARAAWEEWPGFAKRLFCRRHPTEPFARERLAALCADKVGVEVAIAFGAGGQLPTGAACPENPALGADRQAWIAFNRGDLVLCRKLLAMAPERSLVRLFLEARLARLDGEYGKSAERLHAWLDEYRRKGARPDDLLTGYGIDNFGEEYWYTGTVCDGECGFGNSIHYSGPFGPSGRFWEGLYGCSRDRAVPQSHEPTLSRIVSGELGVVKVATRDLEEALYAFLLARNWIDIAFVAERCMAVDELVRFMRGGRIEAQDRDLLQSLLMRRLVRCGRLREAVMWAPPQLKPLCEEYCALSTAARADKADADERALACLNLSRLTLTRGMELMGTELRPDVAIYDGCYPTDAFPIAEPDELPKRMNLRGPDAWAGWKAPQDRVPSRFHYRRKAIEHAREAATLAKDADVRAWSLMFGGIASLSLDDAQAADWFYKRLAVQRHPHAKVGTWFDSPAYQWFRSKYYNEERHVAPPRVPPRLTREQLKHLKVPQDAKEAAARTGSARNGCDFLM